MTPADHSPVDESPSLSRRSLLATVGATIAGSIAGCTDDEDDRGASGVPTSGTGNSSAAGGIGSGYAYQQPAVSRDQVTHIVRTAEAFLEAVQAGTVETPAVIWIPPDAAIDLSGRSTAIQNAVIASTRSVDHPGGIIYSNSMGESSSVYRGGMVTGVLEVRDNVRITGIRFRGPTSATWDHPLYPGFIPYGAGSAGQREAYRSQRHSRGLNIVSGNVQVDNCEIFGWSTQGINIDCPRSYGRRQDQSYPQISNCSIHDCGLSGYGYGVEVNCGHPVIQKCYFNGCRHMIAGEGYPDCGYTLSKCFLGPAGSLFPIDMHYVGENIGGTSNPDDYRYRYHSGGLMRILNCTVAFSHVINIAASSSISAGGNPFAGNATPAISIGGLPTQGVVVQGCQFVHGGLENAISQGNVPGHASVDSNGFARFDIKNNQFGLQTNFSVGQP